MVIPKSLTQAILNHACEAAQECSPRRKPWVKSGTRQAPRGESEATTQSPPGLESLVPLFPALNNLRKNSPTTQSVGLAGAISSGRQGCSYPRSVTGPGFVVARTHYGPALTAPESAFATGADRALPSPSGTSSPRVVGLATSSASPAALVSPSQTLSPPICARAD